MEANYCQQQSLFVDIRIENLDEKGDIALNIPAELRTRQIINLIDDGDRIKVSGRFNHNKILQVTKLVNSNTGATFNSQYKFKLKTKFIWSLMTIYVVATIVYGFLRFDNIIGWFIVSIPVLLIIILISSFEQQE